MERPPFAPPFLRAGRLIVGQTANILQFLGPRHALAPRTESGRLWTHELQLTIADLVAEVHDTHHPVAVSLYYEDQKKEARRKAADFLKNRMPKYLGYFEKILASNSSRGPLSAGRQNNLCGSIPVSNRGGIKLCISRRPWPRASASIGIFSRCMREYKSVRE